ncbi:MAG: TM0106 family RecB-like putative nuclease [Candidatus Eremiobacteraeota bacterium]|nr:TM0106 family RecB-like putative nuclease [Candidatus Eremiobacteraeota bacterium]
MQLLDGRLTFSATDLNNFLECEHLVRLEQRVALGKLARPPKSAQAELIAGKGNEHEKRHLQRLRAVYDDVVTIEAAAENSAQTLRDAADATAAAMQRGARIIYQGVFYDGIWLGKSDFLLRVETPSAQWPWSYEVADTKLALHTKPYFVIQLSFYSEQVAAIQGTLPTHMHAILGDGRQESHRVNDYRAYYQHLKKRFAGSVGGASITRRPTYPWKVSHCDVCAWDVRCRQQRDDEDHLSLVARIRRDQIKKLEASDITTLAALALATLEQRPLSMAEPTFNVLARQARLQHRQREAFSKNGTHDGSKYFYELLDPKIEQAGFALLPQPAPGDVYFDMEGDPLYMPGRGLEYLFGVYMPDDPQPFRSFWGHTPAEEKQAFEAFVDFVTERRKHYPGMHIYHYAPYEKVALRRLMGLHGTREAQVDDLLRDEVLVDLFAIVRQGLVISQPSYSIKKLEAFYEMKRATETQLGSDSIVMYETWLHDPTRNDILEDIEKYNQDDCRSTWLLREWLLELRDEAIATHGPIPWYQKSAARPLCHPEPVQSCNSCAKREREERALNDREKLRERLLTCHPEQLEGRVPWMLAHLLEYHRREQKPIWWAFYDRCENRDELIGGDNEAIGGLQLCDDAAPFKRSSTERNFVYTYSFPDQQYKLKIGETVFDPATRKAAGELIAIDAESNRLQLKRAGTTAEAAALRALIPGRPVPTDAQDDSLERIARAWLDEDPREPGSLQRGLVEGLLLRTPPRLADRTSGDRVQPESPTADALTGLIRAMDGTHLFIQGPPGSGKSTKAARVIADLLRDGKRIGVLSNSHQAIHNLLHKIEEAALANAVVFSGLQKAGSGDDSVYLSKLAVPMVQSTSENGDFAAVHWQLAAGTSWLFAREELAGSLDYLFIDEAGQIALADAIAVTPCSNNIVLLGDPLQLAQVSQGVHPDGIGASALEHLLGEDATVSPFYGVFLDESYRMHPEICEFISHNVYENRLRSAPQTRQQRVEAAAGLSGAGLRFIEVAHEDNAQESPQEAERLCDEIETLLHSRWIDDKGETRPLAANDILVVTPYNAQRRCIARAFEQRNIAVRVGTVDKFQGQEAAVVFFSMATSSSEEMPGNIEFLFSKNRFNVAISRARCLAVLVASPRLLDLRCSTIEQMALINLLCSFVAAARDAGPEAQASDQLALF